MFEKVRQPLQCHSNIFGGHIFEHRKRDHFGQIFKTELLGTPYSSYLGLRNDTSWEVRSVTTTKIQDAKVAPHGK